MPFIRSRTIAVDILLLWRERQHSSSGSVIQLLMTISIAFLSLVIDWAFPCGVFRLRLHISPLTDEAHFFDA
jgi:hypothetical protein